ncbi:hypothetical protein [Kitasatospora sp. NPDC127116]|uniref:hypothetical protein n=2 Tax=unclassified Kitasatospora TaxID=2633591 RepID=UPI00364448B6
MPGMTDSPDTGAPDGTRPFATAREPAEFPAVGVQGVPGVLHAGDLSRGRPRTLCGLRCFKVFLCHFEPGDPASCRKCRALVGAAPSR